MEIGKKCYNLQWCINVANSKYSNLQLRIFEIKKQYICLNFSKVLSVQTYGAPDVPLNACNGTVNMLWFTF